MEVMHCRILFFSGASVGEKYCQGSTCRNGCHGRRGGSVSAAEMEDAEEYIKNKKYQCNDRASFLYSFVVSFFIKNLLQKYLYAVVFFRDLFCDFIITQGDAFVKLKVLKISIENFKGKIKRDHL